MLLDLNDPLQNGRVILGVGADIAFDFTIQALFIHILLYRHYFFENREDISFSMRQGIQTQELFLSAK